MHEPSHDTLTAAIHTNLFQPPQNSLVYSFEQGANTDFFQLDAKTGNISLKKSLIGQTAERYELRVKVTDQGTPPRASNGQATVSFRVARNQRQPTFTNLPANISVQQTDRMETEVFSVQARDDDVTAPFNKLTYNIVGDDNAPVYFSIDQEGRIKIKSDLRGGPGYEVQYKVRHSLYLYLSQTHHVMNLTSTAEDPGSRWRHSTQGTECSAHS